MTDYMPSLDVSAALQAAVAAAAEIARVGLTENQLVELKPRSKTETATDAVHDRPKNPVATNPPARHGFSNPPSLASPTLAATAATTTSLLGRLQPMASAYKPIVEAPSVDSTAYSSETEQPDASATYHSTRHDSIDDQHSLPGGSIIGRIPSHTDVNVHSSPNSGSCHQQNNNDTLSVTSSNVDSEHAPGSSYDDKSSLLEESEEDAAKRLARSRERNREHARRTRLRKKAQLEHLQQKVRALETEKKGLKQKIEEQISPKKHKGGQH